MNKNKIISGVVLAITVLATITAMTPVASAANSTTHATVVAASVGITIDFTDVDFGTLVATQHSTKSGDAVFGTADKPTVLNAGGVQTNISIITGGMFCVVCDPMGEIPADQFTAALIAICDSCGTRTVLDSGGFIPDPDGIGTVNLGILAPNTAYALNFGVTVPLNTPPSPERGYFGNIDIYAVPV